MLDKNNVVPLYYQLMQHIKDQIEKGILKENDKIPAERELCERYNVSRMTVRQALDELVREGVIYRKRGVGTFVAKPKVNQELSKVMSFTEDMLSRNMKPGSKTLKMVVVPAPKNVAEQLKIEEGEDVIELYRLRLADNEPMAVERSFLLYNKAYRILEESIDNKSLYVVLREKCNLNIIWAREIIEIEYSNREIAELLGIKQNSPVFLRKRTSFLSDDSPIEYVESYYRADRYKFSVVLR